MMLQLFGYRKQKQDTRARAPLISFGEAAQLFEITLKELNLEFMNSEIKIPETVFKHHSRSAKNSYYNKAEMLAWRKNNLKAIADKKAKAYKQ